MAHLNILLKKAKQTCQKTDYLGKNIQQKRCRPCFIETPYPRVNKGCAPLRVSGSIVVHTGYATPASVFR